MPVGTWYILGTVSTFRGVDHPKSSEFNCFVVSLCGGLWKRMSYFTKTYGISLVVESLTMGPEHPNSPDAMQHLDRFIIYFERRRNEKPCILGYLEAQADTCYFDMNIQLHIWISSAALLFLSRLQVHRSGHRTSAPSFGKRIRKRCSTGMGVVQPMDFHRTGWRLEQCFSS